MTPPAKAHPHEKPHHPHWPLAGLLFAFVFILGLLSVHQPGTWLHIRIGADILAGKGIPAADPFSYTVAGAPWTTNSWLSDVLFYLVHVNLGPQGLVALKALVGAAAYALLLPVNPASPLAAAGVLALAALSAWRGFTETPAVFDWLFLALMIRVMRPRRTFRWSLVLQVLVLEFAWANFHGSTAVLGVWLAGLKVFKGFLRAERREESLGYAAVFAAAAAGLAANPQGLSVLSHLFDGSGVAASVWQPLSPWLNLYVLFALAGAAACGVCLQQEFFLTTTAATLLALSLLFPRLQPLYLLGACPAITLALGHFLPPLAATPSRLLRLAAALGAFLTLHWVCLYAPLAHWRGYSAVGLEGSLNYLKANGVRGRLFNEAETGAAIVGQTNRPVFVDQRRTLYGAAFMKDAEQWPARFKALSDIYGFDYALILNRRAGYPAGVLDEDSRWRLAYADDEALVYLRRGGADGWLVASLSPALLHPNRLWPDELDGLAGSAKRLSKVLEELDRWLVQSPDSVQALLWKAYALDRLKLSQKAERLILLAETRPSLWRDPELEACLGFVYERRGEGKKARRLYLDAANTARRRGDRALESAVLLRLAPLYRKTGDAARADNLERRARDLAAPAPGEDS